MQVKEHGLSENHNASREPMQQTMSRLSPFHITVVEDDQGIRGMLKILLSSGGFEVTELEDGQSALKHFESSTLQTRPDLILLDLMMPVVNGFEVLKYIRTDPSLVDTPVIFLTAINTQESIVRAFAMGANDYLIKPFKIEELQARIQAQMAAKQEREKNQELLRELQRIDKIRDKHLQIASHDLRGPLSTLDSGLQLLSDEIVFGPEVVSKVKPLVESLRKATSGMWSIVNDFMDLEMIKAGHLTLKSKPLNLNVIAGNVITAYQPTMQKRRMNVELRLDPYIRACTGDEDRLYQVMTNLVINAVKYSPEGGQIVVSTSTHEGWSRFAVQDNGTGIAEDDMPLLFQDFVQLHDNAENDARPTGDIPSAGIGLSITRQLVEMHGGRVGAQSIRGVGSTFWFELPAAQDKQVNP